MSREYVDRGPYLCRYEACHGWVVYLNDAGDLKYLCETNAEAKAKDIVGIMNADVARFDAKMRTPAPATAVEEARVWKAARDVLAQCSYSVHPDGTELVTPFHVGEFNRAMLVLRALLAAEAAAKSSNTGDVK